MKKIFTLLLFVCVVAFAKAQTMQVSGKVTSANDGQTLPGTSVIVKGTLNGAITDEKGEYKINCDKNAVLQFRFTGMKTAEMAVNGQSVINAVLQIETNVTKEVVITAIGVKKEKRSLGYATQQVGSDELTKGENTSALSALQGKISGVNITSGSNIPGGSTRIVLRGGSSLTGDNQPLMIVDGVPINNANNLTGDALNNQVDYGNRGNDINPDDIETISVLKGPAAAALYGQNASNGAIVITTKHGNRRKGDNKKINVTYHTSLAFQNILKLPTFQNQYGEGDQDNIKDDRRENFSWGLPFDGHLRPYGQIINGEQLVKPYSALPNNVKDFFNTGTTWTNSVSFDGGNEKNAYFVSINALNNSGVIPTTNYNKYNIRLNTSSEITDKLSSSFSVNYTTSKANLPTSGQGDNSYLNNIYQTPRDISLLDLKNLNNPHNAMNMKTDSGTYYGYYGAYTVNPWFALQNNQNINNVDRMTGSFSLNYKLAKGLELVNRTGMDMYSDNRYQMWAKYSAIPFENASNTPNTYYDGWTHQYVGKYSEDLYNFKQLNNDLMLNYKTNLSDNISLNGMFGNNIYNEVLNNSYGATNASSGLVVPGVYTLANSNGPIDVSTRNVDPFFQKRLVGLYGNIDLGYKDYLYLNMTGRNDWSSTLPQNKNSYFYPAASTAFIFSEFLKGKLKEKYLNYGKLRIAAASVGHDANPYRLYNTFGATSINTGYGTTVFPLNSIPSFSQSSLYQSGNLQPEKTKSFEIGTEMTFLNDRLGMDMSWFTNTSENQILAIPVAPSTGFTSNYTNTGSVRNRGIELLLRGTPISYKGFRWDLIGTYTKVNNVVLSLANGVDQITLGGFSGMSEVAAVGKTYGQFYAIDIQKTADGKTIVDPTTGLPLRTTNPVYLGSYLPKYTASFRSNFSYKGWNLSVLFDTKQGGVFYSNTKALLDFGGTAYETAYNPATGQAVREDYVVPNSVYLGTDNQYHTNTTKMHPYTYYTDAGVGIPPGQMIVDASYIKLRELSLGYTFPKKYLGKMPFNSAYFGVFANNLFIWTPKSNKYIDPEINSSGASNVQGFDFTANPSLRVYGMNLKITF